MQRIVVMGPPGSGKSTLARRLGARHGLPVFHLDQAYWRPGWVERWDPGFPRFAWSWNRAHRARCLALVDGFAGRKVVVRVGRGSGGVVDSGLTSIVV